MTTPLLLLGCGNMGSALLSRWCETLSHVFAPIYVVEPTPKKKIEGVHFVEHVDALPKNFSPAMIVLAVKPQSLDVVLPTLAKKFFGEVTYLSIAAGKSLAYYEKLLGQGASIVRAMPNTPAMIGEGITAMVGNKTLSYEGRTHATQLMATVGETIWLDDEKLMDAVTAISGSGPAYYYIYMAAQVEAAVKHGLAPEIAEKLVIQTAIGSAKLASLSDEGLCTLINNVTSPNGTTAAARAVLEKDGALEKLVSAAIAAAVKRAGEL